MLFDVILRQFQVISHFSKLSQVVAENTPNKNHNNSVDEAITEHSYHLVRVCIVSPQHHSHPER